MTGFAFAHGTVGDMTSPTRMPVHLLAFKKPAKPVSASDSALRSAIVNVASYYLRMAQTKSPAEMEAIIWGKDSLDGVDHGESCAAFASLTLALGAQATGQESWVTGGATYPWPLHQWADVRVDPNPASPGIISVLQDAQAHQRWHPLGDGYQPQPGDWVLFDGHVEVVTRYSGGVLYTIGGDSGPDLSVNAHTYSGPLAAQGVAGFVNNGELLSAISPATSGTANSGAVTVGAAVGGAATGGETAGIQQQGQPEAVTASAGEAVVPGIQAATLTSTTSEMANAWLDGRARHRDRFGHGARPQRGGQEGYGQDGWHSGRNGKCRHAGRGDHTGRDGRRWPDGGQRGDRERGHDQRCSRGEWRGWARQPAASGITGAGWFRDAGQHGGTGRQYATGRHGIQGGNQIAGRPRTAVRNGGHPGAAGRGWRVPWFVPTGRAVVHQEQPAGSGDECPGHRESAGLYQPGRAGCHRGAEPVRDPGGGDDRAGYRRIRLGPERTCGQG